MPSPSLLFQNPLLSQNPKIQNHKSQNPDQNPNPTRSPLPSRLLPPVQPPPRPLGPYPPRRRRHLRQGRRRQYHHHCQPRPLPRRPRRRPRPLQPRPPPRPLVPRQFHRPRRPQRPLPPRLGTRPRNRFPSYSLLCISKPRSKLPLNFGTKTLLWFVDALKAHDFILIDCPAGIDAGFITAIAPANEAIVVTTSDITALRDADRVIGLLECDGIKDIKMIANRVRTDLIMDEDMMLVLDVQEMLGLELLGVVPEDAEVIRSMNRGFPLVLNRPPSLGGSRLSRWHGGWWRGIA